MRRRFAYTSASALRGIVIIARGLPGDSLAFRVSSGPVCRYRCCSTISSTAGGFLSHEVKTVVEMGWRGTTNGKLLALRNYCLWIKNAPGGKESGMPDTYSQSPT